MTKQETSQLMDLLKAAYPRYYAGKSEEERKQALLVWEEMLRDYPLTIVKAATKALIATLKFPPSISEVIEKIQYLTQPREMSEGEAWALVLHAVGNAAYHSEQEFEKLPEDVQSAVGSPRALYTWAMAGTDELSTVIQSNFMRTFRARAAQQREYRSLPRELKTLVSGLFKNLEEAKALEKG